MAKEKDVPILVRVAISSGILILNLYIVISLYFYGYIYIYEDNKILLLFEIMIISTGIILNLNGLKILLNRVSTKKEKVAISDKKETDIAFIDGLIKSVDKELNDGK